MRQKVQPAKWIWVQYLKDPISESHTVLVLDSSTKSNRTLPATVENLQMEWPVPMGGGYHFRSLKAHSLTVVWVMVYHAHRNKYLFGEWKSLEKFQHRIRQQSNQPLRWIWTNGSEILWCMILIWTEIIPWGIWWPWISLWRMEQMYLT